MKQQFNQDIKYFAVIDTETNWCNEVMSIGVIIADTVSFEPVAKRYYIITPECSVGGMYSDVMIIKGINVDLKKSRFDVLEQLIDLFQMYEIKSVFAYNAAFDYKHLPELQAYMWFDIMKFAAYRQYNKKIPANAECCATGRLKRNYGVEPIMQMLSEDYTYHEVHNAVCDAADELRIMKLLGYAIDEYFCTQINSEKILMTR